MAPATYPIISTLREYNLSILPDLQEIGAPLYENYYLKFLTFRRLYTDGRIIHLSNHQKWLHEAIDNAYWQSNSSLQRINRMDVHKQHVHLWAEQAHQKDRVYGAMHDLDLWHGITLYDKTDTYVDLWAFATDRDNPQIRELYLNDMATVKRFMLYTFDRAHDLFFPTHLDISIPTQNKFEIHAAAPEAKQGFDIRRYFINEREYLTPREFTYVYHLSKGLSCKQIAFKMGVSPRTVESYAQQLKGKIGTSHKATLLKKCAHLFSLYQE